jgi:hypothetical protein
MCEQRLDYEDPWQATAALLFLMTQWSQSQCARLIPLIVEHLSILERHANADVSPIMREVCAGLQAKWRMKGPAAARAQFDAMDAIDLRSKRLLH